MEPSGSPEVAWSCERDIACITLRRIAKKNALTRAMYATVAQMLEHAESNPQIRVCIMTGEGDVFTAGNDLYDFMNDPPTGTDTPVFRFLTQVVNAKKPIIAAVNGAAIGIGTTMLLHCDFVFAAERATFQMPFVDLGLCPEGGSSYLLPRIVGSVRAAELLMLGERFDAQQALAYGLINRVCSSDTLMPTALECARKLASKPPASLRLTKSLLRGNRRRAVEDALYEEGREFLVRLRSDEAAEAFRAFFERRPADFSRFE